VQIVLDGQTGSSQNWRLPSGLHILEEVGHIHRFVQFQFPGSIQSFSFDDHIRQTTTIAIDTDGTVVRTDIDTGIDGFRNQRSRVQGEEGKSIQQGEWTCGERGIHFQDIPHCHDSCQGRMDGIEHEWMTRR
jgi:hypothetical protein